MEKILDPRGFSMEEIFRAYEGLCRKTVQQYGFNPRWTEDLFQECVLELCRCARDFDPGRGVKFPAYVQQALKFRVYGLQRNWMGLTEASLDDGEDWQEALVDEDLIEDLVCQEESRKALETILDQLPPRQREVLSLYYYQELSLSEIAGFLGLAYKTVENTKANGLKNLRRMLNVD